MNTDDRAHVDNMDSGGATGQALFACVDPEAGLFPRPVRPVLPFLTLRQLSLRNARMPVFLSRPHRFFPNARAALGYVLTRERLRGRKVLVPGYMCKSVIEPLLWNRSEPVFYDLHEELQVNVRDFANRCEGAGAAIVTHFFGRPQPDITELRTICRRHGVLLIEDCAHALLGEWCGQALGTFGDYAIASTVKFCPGVDGGLLMTAAARPRSLGGSTPAWPTIRAVRAIMRCAIEGHLRRLRPATYGARRAPAAPAWRSSRLDETEPAPRANGSFEWFRPGDIELAGDALSYHVLHHLDYDAIAACRRANFTRYLQLLEGRDGCRPIFHDLGDGTVPYMFPLLIEHDEPLFRVLKFAGIPIWRWEQQHIDAPAIGQRYGRRLLQLPCHQCMTLRDVDELVAALLHIVEAN